MAKKIHRVKNLSRRGNFFAVDVFIQLLALIPERSVILNPAQGTGFKII
jgi:hypothetical protein